MGRHLILFFPKNSSKTDELQKNYNTEFKSGRGVLYVYPGLSVCQYGSSVRALGLVLVVQNVTNAHMHAHMEGVL